MHLADFTIFNLLEITPSSHIIFILARSIFCVKMCSVALSVCHDVYSISQLHAPVNEISIEHMASDNPQQPIRFKLSFFKCHIIVQVLICVVSSQLGQSLHSIHNPCTLSAALTKLILLFLLKHDLNCPPLVNGSIIKHSLICFLMFHYVRHSHANGYNTWRNYLYQTRTTNLLM